MHIIDLKSPSNTVVQTMSVSDGALVEEGAVLLTLDSSQEEKLLEEIHENKRVLESFLESLSEANVKLRLSKLNQIIEDDQVRQRSAAIVLDSYSVQQIVGATTALETLRAQKSFFLSRYQTLLDQVTAEQYAHDSRQSRAYINIILNIIQEREKNARHKISRFTLKAPRRGRARLHVGVGGHVKLGFIVCQLY